MRSALELAVDVPGLTVGEEDIAAELGVRVHAQRVDALEAAMRRPAAGAGEGQRAGGEVSDMAVRFARAVKAEPRVVRALRDVAGEVVDQRPDLALPIEALLSYV